MHGNPLSLKTQLMAYFQQQWYFFAREISFQSSFTVHLANQNTFLTIKVCLPHKSGNRYNELATVAPFHTHITINHKL